MNGKQTMRTHKKKAKLYRTKMYKRKRNLIHKRCICIWPVIITIITIKPKSSYFYFDVHHGQCRCRRRHRRMQNNENGPPSCIFGPCVWGASHTYTRHTIRRKTMQNRISKMNRHSYAARTHLPNIECVALMSDSSAVDLTFGK